MNSRDHDLFEAELRRLAPAPPPAELMAKLAAAIPQPSTLNPQPSWQLLLRWLVPAAAAAAVVGVLLVWQSSGPETRLPRKPLAALTHPPLRADNIEIDRQLVAAFDAVARLPGGQPVRFRCREWADEVVLRDPTRRLVIESRTPRLAIVPVSFETY